MQAGIGNQYRIGKTKIARQRRGQQILWRTRRQTRCRLWLRHRADEKALDQPILARCTANSPGMHRDTNAIIVRNWAPFFTLAHPKKTQGDQTGATARNPLKTRGLSPVLTKLNRINILTTLTYPFRFISHMRHGTLFFLLASKQGSHSVIFSSFQ